MSDAAATLDALAAAPVLLVGCDFDGTLSEIVADPASAAPLPEAMAALARLADIPSTHVAILSGRARADLETRCRARPPIRLVGSHGAEVDANAVQLAPDSAALLARVSERLSELVRETPGAVVEAKPTSVAMHVRGAAEPAGSELISRALGESADWPGVLARHGKRVLEFSVVTANKGQALERLRHECGAPMVLYVGDDVTDEDAFGTLTATDVGIKVGAGATRASHHLTDPHAVADFLESLARLRAALVRPSIDAVPIEQHALLSDQRTQALVRPDGRIVWLCLPRLDAPAIFCELLGGPAVGFFEVRPADDPSDARQSYLGDTFTLESRWDSLTVIDYLDCSAGRPYQRAGRTDLVRVVEGRGRVRIRFAPRLDFGRSATELVARDDAVEIASAIEPIVLRAPGVVWQISREQSQDSAEALVDLTEAPLVLELRFGAGFAGRGGANEPERRAATGRFWTGWATALRTPAVAAAQVRRSALLIKALTYGPTGGIAAAATTSLPELLGGARNWDYRYCWPRDAAIAAAALVRVGNTGIALKFLDWMLAVVDRCESPAALRPIYDVTGGMLTPEAELSHLSGYAGSRPVRIGNAAAQQVQLDVFGPIVDLVALLAEHDAPITPEHWRLVRAMVEAVETRWHEPDHGIWEVRGPRRHYVHSKLMCWRVCDQAIRLAALLGRREGLAWRELRRAIADDLSAHGFKPARGAFTQSYDCDDADAAALCVVLAGFVEPDDPRALGTLALVERELYENGTVFRYRGDDGLVGTEGGFNLCTCWLIEALVRCGRATDARNLFDQYLRQVGPTGLISEETDPATGQSLGNYPQAYSHAGLINAAIALDRAAAS